MHHLQAKKVLVLGYPNPSHSVLRAGKYGQWTRGKECSDVISAERMRHLREFVIYDLHIELA